MPSAANGSNRPISGNPSDSFSTVSRGFPFPPPRKLRRERASYPARPLRPIICWFCYLRAPTSRTGVRIVRISEPRRGRRRRDDVAAKLVLHTPVRHVGIRILLRGPVIQPTRHLASESG